MEKIAREIIRVAKILTNPELLSKEATHLFNGNLVKIFPSTGISDDNTISGEILTGRNKGKWTTVDLDKAKPIKRVPKRIIEKLLTAG